MYAHSTGRGGLQLRDPTQHPIHASYDSDAICTDARHAACDGLMAAPPAHYEPTAVEEAILAPHTQHAPPYYSDGGGTTCAIAGADFCVIATDTRQSEGYSINTRYVQKGFPLNSTAVLASTGNYADTLALTKHLWASGQLYLDKFQKQIQIKSLAQLLAITLYGRRFFPYYVYNILGGLDADGKGAVYSYDPVGSFERENYRAGGSAASLIQPFLDNQIGRKNMQGQKYVLPKLDFVLRVVKDAFVGAAERDIKTGDQLQIFIVTKEGIRQEMMELKKD